MRVLVVGYGPGGVSAASAARTFAPDAEVVVITAESTPAHRRPGASLGLEFPYTRDLDIRDWSFEGLRKRRIEVWRESLVVDGDLDAKTVEVIHRGTKRTERYDRLILAMGGTPVVPSIPGTDLEGVYTMQNLSDASRAGRHLAGCKSVFIVGAGFSALEVAERLRSMKKKVHLMVRSRLMRRQLEPEMSEELLSRLPDDIDVHMGREPTRINGSVRVESLEAGGETCPAESVLLMTGVRPNTNLAKRLGLAIGGLGGISVNSRMETSHPDVYAVGDCVEMIDAVTGKPSLMPVGSVAARAGRQAGVLAVGGNRIYPDTSLRFQYDRLFGCDICCVGLSTDFASMMGMETRVQFLEDSSEYSKIALVTDSQERLVGGQVLSARMGARLGFQILQRVEAHMVLAENPILRSRHEQMHALLERTLGPIR
ncbi:MAG: FAD-dependent oxidoreductase [Candidatus Thorarchaeota archaeon]|nr:FAD-dependent oxidoreductase [Candidatus Thorarchaeota archaeon]